MKLSKKIIGLLATGSIATLTTTTVVACSSKSIKPEEEHDNPGWDVDVSYDTAQSKLYDVDSSTYSNFDVGDFKLSDDFGAGQEIIVKTTSDEVKLVNEGGYLPHPASTFSLATKLVENPNEDKTYTFGYIFEFYQNDVLLSSKRIDGFTVRYSTTPLPNSLSWKFGGDDVEDTSKHFQLSSTQNTIEISGFELDHPLDIVHNERIEFTAEKDSGEDIQFVSSTPSIDGKSVRFSLKIENIDDFRGAEEKGFHINWKITTDYPGIADQEGTVTKYQFFAKQQYQKPNIVIHGLEEGQESISYEPAKGVSGVYCDSFTNSKEGTDIFFTLDRQLAENESIGVYSSNNKVSVTASRSSFDWQDESANDAFYPLIDLKFDMNVITNPFKAVQASNFYLTFVFYEDNELKAVQDLTFSGTDNPIPFNISYTPLDNPTEDPDDYGITFNPAVVDTDGSGVFTFTGKVARENDFTGNSGLQPGDYMTIRNKNMSDLVTGRDGSSQCRNILKFVSPDNEVKLIEGADEKWEEQASAKIVGTGQKEIQFQLQWFSPTIEIDSRGEPTFEAPDWYNIMTSGPANQQSIYDFISDLEISFYDKNGEKINDQVSDTKIDFLFYPPGFWVGSSDEIVDAWISNRSFALVCTYNEGDTRKIIDGTGWIVSDDNEMMNLVTSWDVANEMKQILTHDREWLVSHDVKFGFSLPTAGSTYNIRNFDNTKYISLDDDFFYFNIQYLSEYGDLSDYINFPAKDPFTWDEDKQQGSNIGIVQINLHDGLTRSMFSLEGDELIKATYFMMNAYYPFGSIFESTVAETIDVDGQHYASNCQGLKFEGKGSSTPITNWDEIKANYSNAVVSGFSSKELEIDGKKQLYYYWTSRKVDFTLSKRPLFKSIEDSAAQNFAPLSSISHQSYAYELPNSYSYDPNVDDAWFSSAGRGAMMVARQWVDAGDGSLKIDIPRVVGVNWNGGARSSIGSNMFKPWIDLFWYENKNLLDVDWFKPYTIAVEN